MTRVSPPELAREFPGPQASSRVTRAPFRRRWRAVQPPKAPAPMTATWGRDPGTATYASMPRMAAVTFPFRPWVRSTCRRALLWGVAVVVAIGGIMLALGSGDREAWGRAFGVLLGYSLLFWVSLVKIWWTAGRPAV